MIPIAKVLLCLLPLLASAGQGVDTQRFPPPDFDAGYELPLTTTPAPRAEWQALVDIGLLVAALSLASWLALKKRSRKALFALTFFSLCYFGFYREGCVCAIGAIQNVALALSSEAYALPLAVVVFFLLPLIFTLFFGRAFCAAVCPLGAVQEMALLRPVSLPGWLSRGLGLLPYVYLGTAVLFAATGSAFIICEYDPFVAFFRLSGSFNMIVLSFAFLVVSFFVGRPYCRFFCPYGVLLGWMGRFSWRRITVAPGECVQCRLCEDSCPHGALNPATAENAPPPGNADGRRLALFIVLLPLLAVAGGWIGSAMGPAMARVHATVRLAERIEAESAGRVEGTTDASEAFRDTGVAVGELYAEARAISEGFVPGGALLGAFLGLVVASRLIGLSLVRRKGEYEADRAGCYACGRCFPACPLELERRRGGAPLDDPPDPGGTGRGRGRSVYRGIAVTAGAFSLVVLILLAWNQAASGGGHGSALSAEGPLFSEELTELKIRLAKDPQDTGIKAEIRRLDLEVRRRYFENREFLLRGAYLLLAGLAVFLLASKRMYVLGRAVPEPESQPPEPEREARRQRHARGAMIAAGLAVAGGALALVFTGGIDLEALSSGAAAGARLRGAAADASLADVPAADTPPPGPEEIGRNWPRFRGPGGLGVSHWENVPAHWDGASGEGILWKTELLLPGHNSPVLWGDRLFLSGADEENKTVFCFHADSGELLWSRPVEKVPGNPGEEVPIMEDTGYAAPTVACDGRRVYALFTDGDAICFDMEGNRLWARYMGYPDNMYGNATSLLFFGNLLLIQYDQGVPDDDQSVLYALDSLTGKVVWRHVRAVAGSWTTPIVIDADGGPQLITCSDPLVIAYDPATGDVLWQADLMGTDVAPAPICAGGMVFMIQPNASLFALRTDGRGDVTKTHLVWEADCVAPDICSPVSTGELIFLLSTMGTLSCLETETGKIVWEEELETTFQASPSLVGETILALSDRGTMFRVKAARTFEEGGRSDLGEATLASPAFADGRIYIRGDKHLFCIGKE
jgi:outer membrane protein assembly factor BamB/ferredoxin